jgi:hypothetical protein
MENERHPGKRAMRKATRKEPTIPVPLTNPQIHVLLQVLEEFDLDSNPEAERLFNEAREALSNAQFDIEGICMRLDTTPEKLEAWADYRILENLREIPMEEAKGLIGEPLWIEDEEHLLEYIQEIFEPHHNPSTWFSNLEADYQSYLNRVKH